MAYLGSEAWIAEEAKSRSERSQGWRSKRNEENLPYPVKDVKEYPGKSRKEQGVD